MTSDTLTVGLSVAARRIAGDELKCPERWLLRRIHDGIIPATKVGRTYRLTEEQIQIGLKNLQTPMRPQPESLPSIPEITPDMLPSSLTKTSARRRRRRS